MSYFLSKTSLSGIIAMIMILVIVIGIMYIASKGLKGIPDYPPTISEMDSNAAVIGNKFYSKMLHCSIAFPDSTWQARFDEDLDSTRITTEQWTTLLTLMKSKPADTTAMVHIEILKTGTPTSADQIARIHQESIRGRYSEKDFTIIRDVTTVGGAGLIGAYHVIEFSPSVMEMLPVRVSMFYVRNSLIYHFLCMADVQTYDALKDEFEYILKNVTFYR